MSPSRPLRNLAPERARRDLPGRPIYPPLGTMAAVRDTQPAIAPDEEPSSEQAAGIPAIKRARTTRAVLVTMIGLNFGAILGLVGWPMLQALKVVNEPVVETVQRNQSELLSQLDASVRALNATVTELHTRVTAAGERQDIDRARLAEIDLAMGALPGRKPWTGCVPGAGRFGCGAHGECRTKLPARRHRQAARLDRRVEGRHGRRRPLHSPADPRHDFGADPRRRRSSRAGPNCARAPRRMTGASST